MTRLPALAAEPRHSRGGAGGVRPRRPARRSGQQIEVPERVYRGPHYSDVFKKIWCKGAALDVDGNAEHCNASVARMAEFTDVSKRTFERGLTEGRHPGPDGGAPEFTTTRKTLPGGRGRTAVREVRSIEHGESFVTVPGWIADAAEPRELAAVLLIAHAEKAGHHPTAAELAGELFHHGGKHKGEPVSERTARRLIDRLEAKGFIDVGHRAGYQGRDTLTVRHAPLQAVPTPETTPQVSPDNHGGSGPDSHGGSLAIKEDRQVCTDGVAQVGGPIRRRRPTATSAREHATGRDTVADTFGRRTGLDLTPHAWRAVWQVLTPVREELPALSGWEWERVVADVLRLLADGQHAERLADRLQRRHTKMRAVSPGYQQWLTSQGAPPEGWRSFSRWLIGAGLTRRGCSDPDCESGTLWPDGTDCPACTLHREQTDAQRRLDAELDEREAQIAAWRAHTPPQRPEPPPPAARPPRAPDTPMSAPQGRIGAPPGTGGWRAVVARERPQAAAHAYRHLWTGDHAHHLHPDTA